MTEPNFRATRNRIISLMKSTSGKFLEAEIDATLCDIYGRGQDDKARELKGEVDAPKVNKVTKIKERCDVK